MRVVDPARPSTPAAPAEWTLVGTEARCAAVVPVVGVFRSGVRIRCVRVVMMPVARIVADAMPSPVAIRVARPMRRMMRAGEAARADARPPGHDDNGISWVERRD